MANITVGSWTNPLNNTLVSGTAGSDNIEIHGSYVTVQGNSGDDRIIDWGE